MQKRGAPDIRHFDVGDIVHIRAIHAERWEIYVGQVVVFSNADGLPPGGLILPVTDFFPISTFSVDGTVDYDVLTFDNLLRQSFEKWMYSGVAYHLPKCLLQHGMLVPRYMRSSTLCPALRNPPNVLTLLSPTTPATFRLWDDLAVVHDAVDLDGEDIP